MSRILTALFAALYLAGCATTAPGPASDAAPVEPLQNNIRWATASEVDNFGFNVYRGDSADGPFVRLTGQPIPGAGTIDEPQRYSFVDDTIAEGEVYYYYVESISMSGVRERFTPTFASKPKYRVAGQ